MPTFDLNKLGDQEFERLIQALLKEIIGSGTTTFGAGPDGAREATFTGRANYPSPVQQWSGNWIFQAKFHDVPRIGAEKARAAILKELRQELEKVIHKYKRPCDNYILATNVPLSSVSETGTHDRINLQILPEFLPHIPHIHIWGYDELARFIEIHAGVRTSFLHLLTPGDLIAELMDATKAKRDLTKTLRLFLRTSFENEQFAQLDQAGDVSNNPLPLKAIFIDLDVAVRSDRDRKSFLSVNPTMANLPILHISDGEISSVMQTLLETNLSRAILIGGPGQGKSTVCQYIAQVHRAFLLEIPHEVQTPFTPLTVRIPFRVILKDYAQIIADHTLPLEDFIASMISARSARSVTSEDVQTIVGSNPVLLILDGLDEVMDRELRRTMLTLITDFITRGKTLGADLQILCTSRPTGYTDQYDPAEFLHLQLAVLKKAKILEYTEKWVSSKALAPEKSKNLLSLISECIGDSNFASLMNTPLQVTIFILIILGGGTPPRQREELFDDYLEVIYKRERSKSKTIIQTEKRLLFGLHQYLAYYLHHRAAEGDTRSRLDAKDFEAAVLRYLRESDPYTAVSELRASASLLIKEAHERLVLIVQTEDGYFGFELRSIQEFFAAGHLVDTAASDLQRFARFQAIALPPHWRNVALFFAGRVGRLNQGQAAFLLETCREIDRHKPDLFIKRGAWLALDIAVDRSFGPIKPLQRSALEIALSVLDTDLPYGQRGNLTTKLSELPETDLRIHAVPLLTARAHGTTGIAAIAILDILAKIDDDRAVHQDVLKRLRGSLDQGFILWKAVDFFLPPDMLADLIDREKPFGGLDPNDLAYVMGVRPPYAVDLCRHFAWDVDSLWSIFELSITRYPFVRRDIFTLKFQAPKDKYEQLLFALELVRGLYPPAKPLEEIFSPPMIAWLKELLDLSVDRHLTQVVLVAIMKAAVTLRETGLFGLVRGRLLQLDSKQLESLESLLHKLRGPSAELFLQSDLSSVSSVFALLGGTPADALRQPNNKLAVVGALDPLPLEDAIEVLGIASRNEKLRGQVKDYAGRLRLRKGREHFYVSPFNISLHSVAAIMAKLVAFMKIPEKLWRVGPVIANICALRWSGHVNRKIEESFISFCIRLETSPAAITGSGFAALITRVAEKPGLERVALSLMKLLGLKFDLNEVYIDADEISRASLTRLYRLAATGGQQTIRGFLRYLGLVKARESEREDRQRLNINTGIKDSDLTEFLNDDDSDVRNAAAFLLANGAQTPQNFIQLLARSTEGFVLEELLTQVKRKLSHDELLAICEQVIQSGSAYSIQVQQAVQDFYQQIARSSTLDIQADERSLGLPFQDVLSAAGLQTGTGAARQIELRNEQEGQPQ